MNAPTKPTQLEVYRQELLPPAKADELYGALPSHIKPAVFERNLLNAIMANPDLMKYPPPLIYREVAKAAGLGLLLDPILGEAYIVPAYNYKTKSVEPQLRVGYKGMCKLARHTGDVGTIYAHEVHERDYVEADLGYPKVFHHKPKLFTDRGEIIGYVSVITFKDGTFDFEPMSVEQCHDIRDRSDAWKAFVEKKIKSTPWATDDSEMCKKTTMRRLLKRQQQSPELVAAIRIEDEADFPDANRAQLLSAPRDAAPPRNVKAIEHKPTEPPPEETGSHLSGDPVDDIPEDQPTKVVEKPAAPEPHDIVPVAGKTNSFEGWATAYIAMIETSPDKATMFKWIDLNQARLKTLEKSPEWTGKVKKATVAVAKRLDKVTDPISSGPAEPQGSLLGDMGEDVAPNAAKPSSAARRGGKKAPDFDKDYDGWLTWNLEQIAKAETPETIDAIFEAIDGRWDALMPPDKESLMYARREAEGKLEQ